jgi:hypothetical protein
MSTPLRSIFAFPWFALAAALFTMPTYANQLVYVPLDQPCRLLDTRTSTSGSGPLTAAHGAYGFGTRDANIKSTYQNGNSAGCGVPDDATAVSVNMNLLDATAPGNIVTWAADTGPAPNIGTAVYNPTVSSPAAGQVQYNTGYTTIPLSGSGYFLLQVANGQIDMTINVVGYWLPISWSENRSGNHAIALGHGTMASGDYSTAMGVDTTASGYESMATGYNTHAIGSTSTAMGFATTANGDNSTAMGWNTTAMGQSSTAMGAYTTATGNNSTAIGAFTLASGPNSTAIGTKVSTDGHWGSFIYGDASARSQAVNTADNQFVAIASGGVYFFTSPDRSTGVGVAPGSGSWFSLSNRNAKTAVQPVDARAVLKKVVALPLNTWQYKAQEAKYRHMGPMAQDFYAAFQLGESDKGIDTVDADGVALAAIQGLHAELTEKNHEIAALRAELCAQKKRVATLESLAGDVADLKARLTSLRQTSPTAVSVALAQP